jgi:hypothetical protein
MKLLSQAESALPGSWHIESIRLPGYGLGITYQGQTFYSDTILYEVGELEITSFSGDTLSYSDSQFGNVECTLLMDNQVFPVGIRTLFISGDEIFSGFEYNGPEGTFPIVTNAEKFFWSSNIFNNNYFIRIIDEDYVQLAKANDSDDHVITLRRL